MLEASTWATGLITMVVGMGIVFSFLVILVFAINIMVRCVKVINILCPPKAEEPKTTKKISSNDDAMVALAIAVAASKK